MKQKHGTSVESSVWFFDGCGDVASRMKHALKSAYDVRTFSDLDVMIECLKKVEPSMIIVCIETDAYGTTKKVRTCFAKPIIAITPMKEARMIQHCLEAGANDCLVDPIDPDILSAKIRGLMRVTGTRSTDLVFDSFALTVSDENGRRLKLTKKEFMILEIIARSGTVGATPKEIRLQIWGDFKVVSKSLDVHLFNIRGKLEPIGRFIKFREGRYWLLKEGDA